MNQHTAIARKPRKTAKTAPKAPSARLQSITKGARKAATTMSKVSAKAAQPLVASLKQEEPQTLAKMALAALAPTLAPKLALAALRFAMRNPLMIAAGVVAFAAISALDEKDGAAAT